MTVSITEFPAPNPDDPDEVGWPMCTAAAYWRQGRYEEAIRQVDVAASSAGALGLIKRGNELAMAAATLEMYVQSADAEPASIVVSMEYPSLETMEEVLASEAAPDTVVDEPSKPIAMTLPSGLMGEGARTSRMKRLFPKPDKPLELDFDGSILRAKPK